MLARRPALRAVSVLVAAVSLTSGGFLVVEPLYARHVLHRPPSQFMLFEAAAGIGGVLADLAIPRPRQRIDRRGALAVSAACYGLAAALFIGTRWVAAAYTGAFVWGVAGATFGLSLTTLQRLAPARAHGRVMGVIGTLDSAVTTAGLPVAGAALAVLGIRAGALSLAAATVAAGLACLAIAGARQRAEPATAVQER